MVGPDAIGDFEGRATTRQELPDLTTALSAELSPCVPACTVVRFVARAREQLLRSGDASGVDSNGRVVRPTAVVRGHERFPISLTIGRFMTEFHSWIRGRGDDDEPHRREAEQTDRHPGYGRSLLELRESFEHLWRQQVDEVYGVDSPAT